jgi:HK97 gp10 family phage protein
VSGEIVVSDTIAEAIEAQINGVDIYIRALAEHVRDRFQGSVHVVTGAMQASASVITAHGSDYGEHVAAAKALNPKAEFAPEEQAQPGEAIVQVPVGYAAFEEFGTASRPAHPALIPAIESVRADAEQIARKVFGLE